MCNGTEIAQFEGKLLVHSKTARQIKQIFTS